MDITLNAEKRSKDQKVKKLRADGLIPCSVYSKSHSDTMMAIPELELKKCFKSGAKKINIKIGSKTLLTSVQEVQKTPVTNKILHVSFHAFDANDKIHLTVPVHLEGTAPGTKEGGVVNLQLNEVSLFGPANKLPEEIIVNIDSLALGSSLHISDLSASADYKIEEADDRVIVVCNMPKVQPLEVAAEEGVEAETPEVEASTEESGPEQEKKEAA